MDLKELTIKEATLLKRHLTKTEKRRLNKELFNPCSEGNCIYGLATKYCNSPRAIELAALCTEYSTTGVAYKELVHGAKKTTEQGIRTPLESYIYQNQGSGEKIIDFIKGETETLEL